MTTGAERTAIAVVGHIGAGKSSVCSVLMKACSIPHLGFGSLVRDEARQRALALSRESLQDLGQELLATLGPGGLLDAALRQDTGARDDVVAVDGIRHVSVYEALRERFGRCEMIFLDADESVRLARITSRESGRSPVTMREMLKRWDAHAIESGIDGLRPHASIVIDAAQSEGEVHSAVQAFLETLGFCQRG